MVGVNELARAFGTAVMALVVYRALRDGSEALSVAWWRTTGSYLWNAASLVTYRFPYQSLRDMTDNKDEKRRISPAEAVQSWAKNFWDGPPGAKRPSGGVGSAISSVVSDVGGAVEDGAKAVADLF